MLFWGKKDEREELARFLEYTKAPENLMKTLQPNLRLSPSAMKR
jgi:hypothetical protein